MSYTVLARRYRSTTFDEIVGQEPISRTLQNAIAAERTAHAYLFCGTRGVGKTSMARIFAKALNATPDLGEAVSIAEAILRGDDLDVIEIDGASNRGIQEARDLIAGAGLSPTRCRYKIYIIDEVHMLTREAFNALLKTMEEPPAHVKFILCTTDPQKVPATIQSRCQRFDFRAILTVEIAGQLERILSSEGIEAEDAAVAHVARMGNGSMRDALSLLDRLIASGETTLTMAQVDEILGLPDQSLVTAIVDAIIASDPATALNSGAEVIARGMTVEQALELLTEWLRSLLLLVTCGADTDLVELATDARAIAQRQATAFDANALVYMIALCDAAHRNTRGSVTARAVFDATLARLCLSEHFADVRALLRGEAAAPASKKKTARQPAPAPPPRSADRDEVMVEPKVAPETKPASASPRASSSVSPSSSVPPPAAAPVPDEALWPKVLAAAEAEPRDAAKLTDIEFRAFDGRTLRLAIAATASAQARFMLTQGDAIEELVLRTVGRSVRVVLEAPEAAPPTITTQAQAAEERGEIAKSPVVKRAMELFDGVIARVDDEEENQDV